VACLAAVALVLYLFVFVSTERQLIGTWRAVPKTPDPFTNGAYLDLTFESGGKFSTKYSFGSMTNSTTGTWRLDGKKLTVSEEHKGPRPGQPAITKTDTVEIESIDTKTLKLHRDDRGFSDFTRQ
jgi:hypothetical protein